MAVENRPQAGETVLGSDLVEHGPRAVLATLGADGALLGHENDCVTLPARSVRRHGRDHGGAQPPLPALAELH